jgi:uncharacterized protein (TIGR00369 family)
MKIVTHQAIDQSLCGRPLSVETGYSKVEMEALPCMAADASGLVHGGFIFSLADYAAMIAVNHPNVVLGAAEVKFLKPVRVGDVVLAEARLQEIQRKKHWVSVSVMQKEETVFQGMFTCFALDQHIFSSSP